MELKRVVVTGLGSITPIGNDAETTWKNAVEGVSGAGPITHFDASLFKTQFACEVKGYNSADHFDRKEARKYDLYAQYGVIAAREAVKDAGLEEFEGLNKDRVGVIFAAGIGGLHTFEEEAGYYAMNKDKGPKYNPFFIPKMIADMAAGLISMTVDRTTQPFRLALRQPTRLSTLTTPSVLARPTPLSLVVRKQQSSLPV